MTDLSIITFSQQGDNIPISIVSSTPQIPGITLSNLGHQHMQYTESSFDSTAIPIHVVDATFNDSIYMMLHNISDTPILTQVFQQDGDQTPVAFKCCIVSKAGSHQNILFNGHTMFPTQKLFVVLDSEASSLKDQVYITGYVKRFNGV